MNASDPIISHRMQCRMDAEPAALERLCQVVRIRGFTIEKMQVQMGRGVLDIELTDAGQSVGKTADGHRAHAGRRTVDRSVTAQRLIRKQRDPVG